MSGRVLKPSGQKFQLERNPARRTGLYFTVNSRFSCHKAQRFNMPKTVGYMLTWTTYGTWLQGDEKGYVKNGRILTENKALENSNLKNLKTRSVYLNIQQREAVRNAIIQEAKHHNQKILEIVVCSNHVHLVADYTKVPIDKIAWAYKFRLRSGTSSVRYDGQGLDQRIR